MEEGKMTKEETSAIISADRAHHNYDEIVKCKVYAAANFLKTGELLKESLDNAYWKVLGYDSWESFLGSPDISMKVKWAYDLIRVYRVFVEKLGIEQRELLGIDISKLILVAPVAESDPEWVEKARHLSKSDLKLELGRGPGQKNKILSPLSPPNLTPACCCVCGKPEWEKHHFPLTRGAGGQEHWWIPLCRECHSGYHQDPVKWTSTYKRQWAKYLYDDRRTTAGE